MSEILGVDAGNSNIKVAGERGCLIIPAAIGEYRERKLEQKFSDNDIIYEFNGKKGFAGTLALNESQLLASRMGDSKAHEEMLIRTLIGITKYSDLNQFNIVVGQPIVKHTEEEKGKIKSMLKGNHILVINGKEKHVQIDKVEVASEGGSAFWSHPRKGLVRIIDIGSGTVNASSLRDGRFIDKDSFTISDGLETLLVEDMDLFARKISLHALKYWKENDNVLLCGGGADKILPYIRQYFYNTNLLNPQMASTSNGKYSFNVESPIYANVIGYYNIAKKVFS